MRALVLSALLVASTVSSDAVADDVDRCVGASERGQNARRRRALIAARDAFIDCAAASCPPVVRRACTEWGQQLEATMPTVVIAVTDGDGDVPSATLTLDGRPVAADGSAIAIDPGSHTLEARFEGHEDARVGFVAREGERARMIRVLLPKKAVAPPPIRDEGDRSVRPITWITGGLAVAALGSFVLFAATGASDASELRSTCAPTCSEEQRSAVATKYLVADISLVAAILFGGASVWTLVSRPR